MNKVTQSDINSLAEIKGVPVLSLYLPTHRSSTATTMKEDQARYKAVIAKGLAQWETEAGADVVETAREKLTVLDEDVSFWSKTNSGLAIFADEHEAHMYHLPIECDEYTYIGDSFDLTPLRIVLSKEQPFYLLVLAKHDPKLFYGDSYRLEPVDIELPTSPEDALNIDEMFSSSNTVRGGVGAASTGNGILNTHGQGDTNNAGQEEHLVYLRIIDNKILKSSVINQRFPLLIAATESEASDFKRISNNPMLIPSHVQGNYTMTPLHELHTLAWPVISEEVVAVNVRQLVERFGEDKGRQRASSDVADIHEAVSSGRVHTLLVGIIENTNDSVSDTTKSPVSLLRLQKGYLAHHLRELARQVVAQGGSIVGVNHELLATPTQVAALYRY